MTKKELEKINKRIDALECGDKIIGDIVERYEPMFHWPIYEEFTTREAVLAVIKHFGLSLKKTTAVPAKVVLEKKSDEAPK